MDTEVSLSESRNGSTRFRILNKRPSQGDSRVDGRLTKTQGTPRPEKIWPEVRSSMSDILGARHKTIIPDFPPGEIEDVDATIQNASVKLDIPAEPATPCVARRMGPQGRRPTGNGEPARVPNLRVCKHLCGWGGTERGKGEVTSGRGTVKSAR